MGLFDRSEQLERPDPGCRSYVANRAFDYGEHSFAAGDAFELDDLGVHESKAIDLWVAGLLRVKPSPALAQSPSSTPTPAAAPASAKRPDRRPAR